MPKLKQYHLNNQYRGFTIEVYCLATSWKKATELLETTIHHLRNYGSVTDTITDKFDGLPDGTVIAKFDRSGEAPYLEPGIKTGQFYTLEEVKKTIDYHRAICPTYTSTIEWYDNKHRL